MSAPEVVVLVTGADLEIALTLVEEMLQQVGPVATIASLCLSMRSASNNEWADLGDQFSKVYLAWVLKNVGKPPETMH